MADLSTCAGMFVGSANDGHYRAQPGTMIWVAKSDRVDPLLKTLGSAKRPDRPVVHPRSEGTSDAAVTAAGKLSEALEAVEQARGHLYAFHRLSGTADRLLAVAVEAIQSAGQQSLADVVETVLVGRDVIADMWTFQLVEAYDQQYWEAFRLVDRYVRDVLVDGKQHVFEAEMKQREQE